MIDHVRGLAPPCPKHGPALGRDQRPDRRLRGAGPAPGTLAIWSFRRNRRMMAGDQYPLQRGAWTDPTAGTMGGATLPPPGRGRMFRASPTIRTQARLIHNRSDTRTSIAPS